MFVDTSAIIAILRAEPRHGEVVDAAGAHRAVVRVLRPVAHVPAG